MSCRKEIFVYVHHNNGNLCTSSLELLGKAKKLSIKIRGKLSAILIGSEVNKFAEELIAFGADKVYFENDEKLKYYLTLPHTRSITNLILKEKPDIVLMSADTTGRDLAPRVAARLETGLTADCIDLDIGNYEDKQSGIKYENILLQVVPAFGGNVMATIVCPERRPQMATVRPGIFDLPQKGLERKGEIIEFKTEWEDVDWSTKVLEVKNDEVNFDLEKASKIVAGGRGCGGKHGFELLTQLAEVIDGKIGATRAATEAGWISNNHMIGSTGKTVKPDLFISCGISGSMHHLVGMKNSRVIVAINKDPKASIFSVADYAIVGDILEIVPKLISKLIKK